MPPVNALNQQPRRAALRRVRESTHGVACLLHDIAVRGLGVIAILFVLFFLIILNGCSSSEKSKNASLFKTNRVITDFAAFIMDIPKGTRVSPNDFVAVESNTRGVFLFTLNPPKKQLIWRLALNKLKYDEDTFPDSEHTWFSCHIVPVSNYILCTAEWMIGGDEYPLYFISLDINKRKVYYSGLYWDNYDTADGIHIAESNNVLAIQEDGNPDVFHVLELPELKLLYQKNIGMNDSGYFNNIEVYEASTMGSYILASDIHHKNKYQIFDVNKELFVDLNHSMTKAAKPCGFVDDNRVLFIEGNKGIIIDIRGNKRPVKVIDFPQDSYAEYLVCRLRYQMSQLNFTNHFDDFKGIGKSIADLLNIDRNHYSFCWVSFHSNTARNAILIKAQYYSSATKELAKNEWYLWKSEKLQNVTDQLIALFGDSEIYIGN